MSDYGDFCRDMRDRRTQVRRELGEDCIGCITHHPKRNPTLLLPQQTCRVCGHKDQRPRQPQNGTTKPENCNFCYGLGTVGNDSPGAPDLPCPRCFPANGNSKV